MFDLHDLWRERCYYLWQEGVQYWTDVQTILSIPKYIMNELENIVVSSSSTSVTVESYYHVLNTWTRTGPGWCHSCSYQTTAFIGNNPMTIKTIWIQWSGEDILPVKSQDIGEQIMKSSLSFPIWYEASRNGQEVGEQLVWSRVNITCSDRSTKIQRRSFLYGQQLNCWSILTLFTLSTQWCSSPLFFILLNNLQLTKGMI